MPRPGLSRSQDQVNILLKFPLEQQVGGDTIAALVNPDRQVRREARSDLRLATRLEDHDLLSAGMATGQVNAAQARAIVAALDRLPRTGEFAVSVEQRHQAEAYLVACAAEHDATRARALLQESVELSTIPGEEITVGLLTACMVSGRLRDWELTLALAGRSFEGSRWALAPSQAATTLAECARALAETNPDVAGLLQGASYNAFAQSNPMPGDGHQSQRSSEGNFVLDALRETGRIVGATLGAEKRRELAAAGAAMSIDEAVTCALANIDPKLLTGPIASIDR